MKDKKRLAEYYKKMYSNIINEAYNINQILKEKQNRILDDDMDINSIMKRLQLLLEEVNYAKLNKNEDIFYDRLKGFSNMKKIDEEQLLIMKKNIINLDKNVNMGISDKLLFLLSYTNLCLFVPDTMTCDLENVKISLLSTYELDENNFLFYNKLFNDSKVSERFIHSNITDEEKINTFKQFIEDNEKHFEKNNKYKNK